MNNTFDLKVRVAPPDKAAEILRNLGYPVSPKLLRKLCRENRLPSTWTGKRLLIPISRAIELFEHGDPSRPQPQGEIGIIRKVGD